MAATPRRAGQVRLDEKVRAQVDAYAEALGLSYNAAMNILVRIALETEQAKTRKRTVSHG